MYKAPLEARVERLEDDVRLLKERARISAENDTALYLEVSILRKEMHARFDDISEEMSGMRGEIETLKGDVAGLKGDVAELKNDMSGVKSLLSKIAAKLEID